MIEIQNTKRYKVLYDPDNGIWHQIPWWTTAGSVEFSDGETLDMKLHPDFKMVIRELQDNANVNNRGYLYDAAITCKKPLLLEGVVYPNTSSITFQDSLITGKSLIDIYTDDPEITPSRVVASTNTLTLYFEGTRTKDVAVAAVVQTFNDPWR